MMKKVIVVMNESKTLESRKKLVLQLRSPTVMLPRRKAKGNKFGQTIYKEEQILNSQHF